MELKTPQIEKIDEGTTKVIDSILKKKVNGYIMVRVGNTWIPEHRLVVEEHIKRQLTKDEVIHHLNSYREYNRLDNLMILKNKKQHAQFHIKLQNYGYLTNPMIRQIEDRWDNL